VAIIEATTAQLLVSVVDVGHGIFVEKWYVSRTAATLNVINFVIALAAVTLPGQAFVFLAIYAGIGAIAAREHWRRVYVFLGSKTYGSLMFILAIRELGYLNWAGALGQSLDSWFASPSGEIMFGWTVVAIIVHVIGYAYARHKTTRKPF
jgi:hypothetical protein